jgi:hypothetical protein
MRSALSRAIGEDAQTGVHAPVPAISPPDRGNNS